MSLATIIYLDHTIKRHKLSPFELRVLGAEVLLYKVQALKNEWGQGYMLSSLTARGLTKSAAVRGMQEGAEGELPRGRGGGE